MKTVSVLANAVRVFSLVLFLQYLTVAYEVSIWCKILAGATMIVWAASTYVEKELNKDIENQTVETTKEVTEE